MEAASGIVNAIAASIVFVGNLHFRGRLSEKYILRKMSWDTLQIFGYKCLGEGDEQTGGFFGGNVRNVEVHQTRISDGVLNFPLLD